MKSTYIILILALLIGATNHTDGQSVKKADKRVTFYEYAVAVPILEKIIEKDGEGKEDAMIMLADCYRMMNEEQKAKGYMHRLSNLTALIRSIITTIVRS